MSWQDYVNNNLLGSGACSAALISGHDGAVWAVGGDFPKPVTAAELTAINAGFTDPSGFQANGAYLGGERHIFINCDGTVMRLKKGAGGAVIVKTLQTLVLAKYNDAIQPGQCSVMVEKLGDYLKGVGY